MTILNFIFASSFIVLTWTQVNKLTVTKECQQRNYYAQISNQLNRLAKGPKAYSLKCSHRNKVRVILPGSVSNE